MRKGERDSKKVEARAGGKKISVETNDSSLYSVCWIKNSDKASLSIISPGDYVTPGDYVKREWDKIETITTIRKVLGPLKPTGFPCPGGTIESSPTFSTLGDEFHIASVAKGRLN